MSSCAIKWDNEVNSYSTVASKAVRTDKPVILDKLYLVDFGGDICKGKVVFMGTKSECQAKVDQILGIFKTQAKNTPSKQTCLPSSHLLKLKTPPVKSSTQASSSLLKLKTPPVKSTTQSASPLTKLKTTPAARTASPSPKPKFVDPFSSKTSTSSAKKLFSYNSAMQQQKSKHISLSHDDDGDEDYHQASEEEDNEENDDKDSTDDDLDDDAYVTKKPESKKKLMAAKAAANLLFEPTKAEIDLEVMTAKYIALELDHETNLHKISTLAARVKHLEEAKENLKSLYTVEQNQRALKQAVSVIEAIGDHSTILQISNFMKSEDSLQGQVILCNDFPNILISRLKKANLMLEFQKKTPGNLIFCKALSVYYPTDEDWASRNAKSFIAECKPTLDAIIGFILENYTDPISSFSVNDINSTLTSKCSDRRRKMLAQLKAAAEEKALDDSTYNEADKYSATQESLIVKAGSYELVSDGLSESEVEYYARQFDVDNHSSSNDETILELEDTDEEKEITQKAPKKNFIPLNDVHPINKSISTKHKLVSTGELSKITQQKKQK